MHPCCSNIPFMDVVKCSGQTPSRNPLTQLWERDTTTEACHLAVPTTASLPKSESVRKAAVYLGKDLNLPCSVSHVARKVRVCDKFCNAKNAYLQRRPPNRANVRDDTRLCSIFHVPTSQRCTTGTHPSNVKCDCLWLQKVLQFTDLKK